jgi:hypothetical protein
MVVAEEGSAHLGNRLGKEKRSRLWGLGLVALPCRPRLRDSRDWRWDPQSSPAPFSRPRPGPKCFFRPLLQRPKPEVQEVNAA